MRVVTHSHNLRPSQLRRWLKKPQVPNGQPISTMLHQISL